MGDSTFKRHEKKYYISESQKEQLEKVIQQYMDYDSHCKNGSTYLIRNVYYDTYDNKYIRISTSKPLYKEKVRVRKYGSIGDNSDSYFLEIKRKFHGVVSKRRVKLTKKEIDDFITLKSIPVRQSYIDNQVINEFVVFFKNNKLLPKSFISYERLAYKDKIDPNFRLTFDSNIYCRHHDFDFDSTTKDYSLIEKGYYLMEVKITSSMPLWFSHALSNIKIFPKSFSKYGTDFKIQNINRSIKYDSNT